MSGVTTPKHVEQFTNINKLYIVVCVCASCWTISDIYFTMHGPSNIIYMINYFMLYTQVLIDFVTFKPTILTTILSEVFFANEKPLSN
jgi:hypothetical protein